jgi:hypothetical protein
MAAQFLGGHDHLAFSGNQSASVSAGFTSLVDNAAEFAPLIAEPLPCESPAAAASFRRLNSHA